MATQTIDKSLLRYVLRKSEPPQGTTACWFEGYRYGDVDVSFWCRTSTPIQQTNISE
jgi:hypothetical protein